MFRNFLMLMTRNMVRNKLFTIINVFGISVSIACCILLFLFSSRELGYDTQHGRLVYRIISDISQKDGQKFLLASSSVPVGPAIRQQIPEIASSARLTGSSMFGGQNVLIHDEDSWYVNNGYIADTSIFSILKYNIIQGNPSKPMPHNDAIVLEKEWAKKIFGDEDPLGKIIKIKTPYTQSDFEVTAVYDKNPNNSHLTPDFFVPMSHTSWNDFYNRDMTNWIGNNMVYTYVKLIQGADPAVVTGKIHDLLLKNGAEQMKALGLMKEMKLQPVQEIHTTQGYMVEVPGAINVAFIRVLILIGILILVLACVNYINLSTAQAGNRSLEVGVRKVMGVSARGLVLQFLGESFLIVSVSLIVSVILAYIALPWFNRLIDVPLVITKDSYGKLTIYLIFFLFITGLLAGLYPAFYMASFKPATVLKGRSRDHAGRSILRKSLVVLQFVISIGLISAILIISRQVDYIRTKDLGFDPETKLVIPLNTQETAGNYEVLKQKFGSNARVRLVSGSRGIPGSQLINDLLVYKQGQTMEDAIHIFNNDVDLGYLQLLDIKLLSGKYFEDYNRDSTRRKIIISKTGIDMLDISPEDAPGEMVYFDWEGHKLQFEIVGIVGDINQFSLHQEMDAMMYTIAGNSNARFDYITLDADMTDFHSLISDLENQWKEVIVETPFSYYTLNDHLMAQYESDFKTFDLIKYFTFISLLISCLGLYAMSMFLAERRYREIGIRKTFGAGVRNILVMVSRDLSLLILIAFIISIPLSIYAMNRWLETFAFRINPGVTEYLIAGVVSILIGWITISYQSIRAARTNPVNVLREE